MRIGIFSESYDPLLNGNAVSVGTLTRELRRLGHEVFIFAPKCGNYSDSDVDVIRFPSIRTWFERDYPVPIPLVSGLTGRVGKLRLDIIHTQTPWILGWLGLYLARRLKLPLVSTNHTLYEEYAYYFTLAPVGVTRWFIKGMMRRYYSACDGVVVPSTLTGQILTGYGVRTPIYTIPTGIALDTSHDPEARAQVRREYGIAQDETVLLYVGRLAREKNLDLLLQSFKLLCKRHEHLALMVVGGGPYEHEFRQMASKLKPAMRVIITGFVPREKVAKYYSAGDLFTFPSTTETQGLVLGEALLAGLPCVAVNAGGSPEALREGDDSLLADNNIDDFVEKVDMLLADRELMARFSASAVKNAARLSPEYMAARVVEVYESLLTRRLDWHGSTVDFTKLDR